MNKLFLSAFALSLISLTVWGSPLREVEFFDYETDNLPEILGKNSRGGMDHSNPSWQVKAKKVEKDLPNPLKGQPHSLIPWSEIEPEEFLSIRTWLIEREIKDKNPEWKIRLRQDSHQELVGKILQCRGECKVFRGLEGVQVQYLSRILEGDEIRTGKDSLVWIYLMDGSLIRLSPDSSLTLNEIDFSKKSVFLEGRLNSGHIFWSPRFSDDMALDEAPETDSFALPLMLRSANLEQFEREIYQKQNDLERRREVLALDENAIKNQFTKLNSYRKATQDRVLPQTKFLLVAPNVSILASNASFDLVHLTNNRSYFKKRTAKESEIFEIMLRGYTESSKTPVLDTAWNLVEGHGRFHSLVSDVPGSLEILELLTKRIRTIELAREMWFQDFSLPILDVLGNKRQLAEKFGYWLWGEELQKREDFLVEYTRRVETTNLSAIEKLTEKLISRGDDPGLQELTEALYTKSLNHYLLGLKKIYSSERMRVKEMNNVQYYAWILRHGKR